MYVDVIDGWRTVAFRGAMTMPLARVPAPAEPHDEVEMIELQRRKLGPRGCQIDLLRNSLLQTAAGDLRAAYGIVFGSGAPMRTGKATCQTT
jgi:hypothetical protein